MTFGAVFPAECAYYYYPNKFEFVAHFPRHAEGYRGDSEVALLALDVRRTTKDFYLSAVYLFYDI